MTQRLQVVLIERRAARTDRRDVINFLSPFTLASSAPGFNAKHYFAEPLPCHCLIDGAMVLAFAPPINLFMSCGFVRLAAAFNYKLFASRLGAVSEGGCGHYSFIRGFVQTIRRRSIGSDGMLCFAIFAKPCSNPNAIEASSVDSGLKLTYRGCG